MKAAKSPAFQSREEVTPLAPPPVKIKTILVPTDFSPCSVKALDYAVSLAKQHCAKVTLLHVCQVQFYADEFAYMPVQDSAMRDKIATRLNSLATEKIVPEHLGRALVLNGVPFDEIAKVAKDIDADLIVISTHGYTGLKHMLIGSTTERVVRYAPCPVLVVRDCEHEFI